ncbi:hypothetical protein QFC22_005887 [Naganishia vaughanmartiniae]|uniref:Uncharacterized protein n=1 Tax=Naganishia vaughanmartiniae TaxID=1424756 RepID=A0ACC2WR30_9TREE|nr:hypothetical protein QFC22_005887 [Naganishia vaughanmartiniae]
MDKMEASAGAEIIMDDSKGLPPYPAPVDDEYITTEGCAPQPHDQPSIMTAFTPHIELMILLSQCIIECRRYRTFQPPNAQQILSFADRAHDDMERIMQLLPSHLGPRPAYLKLPPASQPRIFAMQRANLMIAGMIVEFALLELESLVRTAIEIQADREDVGHAGCNLLTHLPVIHVAANGAYMLRVHLPGGPFSTDYKTRIIGDYILEHLLNHKASENGAAPLMVAMQGPQGCDLYHTHESLLALRQRHPYNDLLAGRGLPGTHDLQLTRTTLDAVLNCNRATNYHQRIQLPVFDKSLFGGQGDRSTLSISVETPVDVFILEGWSMGFQPLGRDELCRQYEQARSDTTSAPPAFLAHSLDSLMEVNDYLGATSAVLYPPFSLLIQIRPESYSYVHAWRLQQEHQLIAARGTGMTDAQVEEFVTRYMPGYELWASGAGADVAEEGEACKGMWSGKSLVMWFGKERQVVLVDRV